METVVTMENVELQIRKLGCNYVFSRFSGEKRYETSELKTFRPIGMTFSKAILGCRSIKHARQAMGSKLRQNHSA